VATNKENGIENKLKEECRNTISKALQGLEQFEEAEEFNKQNISCYGKSIRAHIIAMRNAVHNKRFDIVQDEASKADQYIAQLKKPEEEDFVGSMFRNQMKDIMNQTNQLLERDELFDYTDPIPLISKKFLPPFPQQILSNTATVAPHD
jgi:DNA primase large subunit